MQDLAPTKPCTPTAEAHPVHSPSHWRMPGTDTTPPPAHTKQARLPTGPIRLPSLFEQNPVAPSCSRIFGCHTTCFARPVCKLGRVLIESQIPHSIADISTILRHESCCGCHGSPRPSRSCQRQLLFYPDQMHAVFGAQHTPLLTTCANAYTQPGSVLIHTRTGHNLRVVCRKIAKTRPFLFKSFSAHVHRLLSAYTRDRSRKNLPSARDVCNFCTTYPQHRAVTLDKNTLCFVVVCYAFWLWILLKAYHDRPEYYHHCTAVTADVMQALLVMYYVILCSTLPVFKRVQPRPFMRTNRCSPRVEGLHLPPLTVRAPTPGCVGAYDAFRAEAFSLAVTWYNDLSQRARARGASPPDALHTSPRAPRSWKVPSTTSTLKHNWVVRVDPDQSGPGQFPRDFPACGSPPRTHPEARGPHGPAHGACLHPHFGYAQYFRPTPSNLRVY